ncbi:MAG: fructose-bisphosphatase class III [Eubacterium sp.]|nr:fructose-bisphosphatase class III [Eubacterium sp.]
MSTFVLSDIHGEYNKFMKMLDEIHFSDNDTLYVLGDVLDRGPEPIKVLMEMMKYPNIIPMIGNHEVMGLPCLRFLLNEITDDFIEKMEEDPVLLYAFLDWFINGCESTIDEFKKLSSEEREVVLDYLGEFNLFETLKINDKKYILVHGGLGNFSKDKKLEEYTIDEIVWTRPDYNKAYFEDVYVITGHTPTQYIESNERPGYIFRKNNHIAIDCGAYHPDGRLAAICLDDGSEYYI